VTPRRLVRHPATVCLAAYAVGAIPFSNLAARVRAGIDLRSVGEGTVSGSGLYQVAGFGPLAIAGIADVAKGAVGPLLAGPRRPVLAAVAAAAGVSGHNWSPFLRGAGGRGLSVAMGALAARHWQGTALLLAGLAAGRLVDEAGFGAFVADAALGPLLWWTDGRPGLLIAVGVVVPMVVKRLVGNRPPAEPTPVTYVHRLLYDNDAARPLRPASA
jgi:glycerol-3-phosphate acyltransferase PlsY